ncbi:MAG: hypothetical protein R6U39_01205 [Candidatus Aegiribacteria sp.]
MGFASAAILILMGGFADELYTQGDYGMAALEYSRVLFEAGDTLGHPEEALRLARCRHLLGDLESSIFLYDYLIQGLPDGDDRARALLGAGSVYAELQYHDMSREAYAQAASAAEEDELLFRSELLMALAPMHRSHWSQSSAELSAVGQRWQGDKRLLAEELSALASRGERLPGRDPFWCGVASAVIPGSGQLICGHTRDGLTALSMTAATGALFILSLDEDNLSTSILLGWLSLSFYGANVYGGSRAAEYYNSARRRELLQEVYHRLDQDRANLSYLYDSL